ncbi:MFS transporter [Phenylobacterium sp.]|uniref:MFS transporter n=1 Tax=Phenylobacterium sp. TaxID=1871053 RepID=UPI00301D2F06
MSFFGNGAVNRVNLHTVIQALSEGAGGVFVLVFLLRAGVPAPLVLCAMAALTAGRFVLRPLVLPLARRIGLRRTLILGTVGEAAVFPLLPLVDGVDGYFLAFVLIGPIGSVLYWTCYHAYFAAIGDDEHRGSQVALRTALTSIVGVIAPLLGAGLLAAGGPWLAFLAAGAIQILAVLPLVGAPEVPLAPPSREPLKGVMTGAALMACDGVFAGGYFFVWQIALFTALDESFTAYGGAMALAAFVGAAFSLWIGKRIDAGAGRSAVVVAFLVAAGVLMFRALSIGSPGLAVTANAVGALVTAVWMPALGAPIYNLAKASACPLRFNVATEAGWDIGCGAACLIGSAMIWGGFTYAAPVLLGLAGAAAAFAILWRRYGRVETSALST